MIITYRIIEILDESEIVADFQNKRLTKFVRLMLGSPFSAPRIIVKELDLKRWNKAKKLGFIEI